MKLQGYTFLKSGDIKEKPDSFAFMTDSKTDMQIYHFSQDPVVVSQNESLELKMSSLSSFKCKGVLLDITGVLYESGHDKAIEGSVQAIEKLRKSNIPFRFVTNETQRTRSSLVSKLKAFGFNLLDTEVFSPGVATNSFIKQNHLHPFFVVHPDILPEFDGCNTSLPNCVVIGDAADHFTFGKMNAAFHILMNSKNPILISMGKGKFYKEKDDLCMDLGGFTCALEYATGVDAIVIGKPSAEYFLSALNDIGVKLEEAIMVGDDINSDVGAAQLHGMKGVLVKTGKFRKNDLTSDVKPDIIVENLAHFVDILCSNR